MSTGRKVLAWLVVFLVVYAILTRPAESGEMTRTGVASVGDGAQSIMTFMDALFRP